MAEKEPLSLGANFYRRANRYMRINPCQVARANSALQGSLRKQLLRTTYRLQDVRENIRDLDDAEMNPVLDWKSKAKNTFKKLMLVTVGVSLMIIAAYIIRDAKNRMRETPRFKNPATLSVPLEKGQN